MPATFAHPIARAAARPVGLTRRRRFTVWALIVIASILAVTMIATTYVKRQMLDNHAWENASTQVVHDPAVRSAVASYLVNELYTNVDVAKALQQQLPPNLDHLAVPLAAALRQPLTSTANFVLGRPRVQELFIAASTRAHNRLVNVLENKTGYGITTGNGVVTLNLHALIEQLGADLGLSAAALARIPNNAGVIVVMRSSQLAAAQQGVRAINALSFILLALVVALYALAVYLARGARRQTLRNVGWALVVVGSLVVLLRHALGTRLVDAIASSDSHATVYHVWLIGTVILGQIGAAAILYGLVTVAGATLAGPTSWATAARRYSAPALRQRPAAVALTLIAAYLLLVLWGPTHALRMWWGILVLGGLLAAGCITLYRRTMAEFPATL